MKLIYISGAYRNATENGLFENIMHAREVAVKLWQENWVVICPHLNTLFMGGVCEEEVWLKGDLEILSRCDGIYLLKNWRESSGAVMEKALAEELGLEIWYEKSM